jgi:hypothetical protein
MTRIKAFSILNSQFFISLSFPHAYIESLRAERVEREADYSVDQTILLVQQRCRELDPVAWRCRPAWPWFARLLYQRAVAILDYQGNAP